MTNIPAADEDLRGRIDGELSDFDGDSDRLTPILQMREIHHRLRNSMNLICCTLQLQGWRSDNVEVRRALGSAVDRIRSFARVHGYLYEYDHHVPMDVAPYLENVVRDLQAVLFTPDQARSLKLMPMEPFLLGGNELTSLGAIVTELVTNAVKYGDGEVRIAVRRNSRHVVIEVDDDGAGFPPDFDVLSGAGFGLRLVSCLCSKASGAISIDRSAPGGRLTVLLDVQFEQQLEFSFPKPQTG